MEPSTSFISRPGAREPNGRGDKMCMCLSVCVCVRARTCAVLIQKVGQMIVATWDSWKTEECLRLLMETSLRKSIFCYFRKYNFDFFQRLCRSLQELHLSSSYVWAAVDLFIRTNIWRADPRQETTVSSLTAAVATETQHCQSKGWTTHFSGATGS